MSVSMQKLTFLGKQFEFPSDLQVYLKYASLFQSMRSTLKDQFSTLVINEKCPELPERDLEGNYRDTPMRNNFLEAAKTAVKILCENEIYSRSPVECLDINPGYQQFCEDTEQIDLQLRSILLDAVGDFIEDYGTAIDAANAKITGTGCGILTSSPFVAGTMGVYEAIVTYGQEREAQVEYQKTLQALNDRSNSKMERRMNEAIRDVFCPAVHKDIDSFIGNLLELVLHDLNNVDKFDLRVLDFVDFQKSLNLLENLPLTHNRQAVLQEAFVCCPFNVNVYQKAIELQLIDDETMKTAEWFNDSPAIRSFLEEEAKKKRIEEYWKFHQEERSALENRKKALLHKIKENEAQLADCEGADYYDEYYTELCHQIDHLQEEINQLNVFQGRQKKLLRAEVQSLCNKRANHLFQKDEHIASLKEENKSLQEEISGIDDELTKPR